jgi:hypothetical protein
LEQKHGAEPLKARIAELEKAVRASERGFIWSAEEYRDVAFCTHPDRVAHLKDEALTTRFAAAFRTVESSKGVLVDPRAEERQKQSEMDADWWRKAMGERVRNRAAKEAERQAKADATREARSAAARAAASKRGTNARSPTTGR